MKPIHPQPHRGLPPLAGITTFGEAMKEGLPVGDSVGRLKRFHYAFWRLHGLLIARLTAEPLYELKMAFSRHGYLSAEADTLFRARVGEMREPPLGLEKIPHPALAVFFDEILCSPTTEDLVEGVYQVAFPELKAALEKYILDVHPLADAPSVRIARIALMDLKEITTYGEAACRALLPADRDRQWGDLLRICLAAAGGLDGSLGPRASGPPSSSSGEPTRWFSSQPYQYDGTPNRDERFPDPYNMGVNAEQFLYDETKPPELKVLMMFYKRLREIDVPEMMAGIITETKGKPWKYYQDMTRQLWDEARHAMMGEVGFASEGIDWPRHVMVNSTWSRQLNLTLKPKERHAVLYFIEQGLMPKTGKRYEWEVSRQSHSPLAATFQDYDWADEVLHSKIGREWYVADMPTPAEAVRYGDECWARILDCWEQWKAEGLTEHRNWWPDLYRNYCESRSTTPDPEILAFDTSYRSTRADLKELK
ncbi:MAG: hypothetical protein EOP87_09360 [Verrucomicrobiaceae bacterium]|nr:MAG: hypothetical protein EOP87_09360 [Verrucomicrobiaceae bacterium]